MSVLAVIAAACAAFCLNKAIKSIKLRRRIASESVETFEANSNQQGLIEESDTGWRDTATLIQRVVDNTCKYTEMYGPDVYKWPMDAYIDYILMLGGKK